MTKLTRQERKEALAEWDSRIRAWETAVDKSPSLAGPARGVVLGLQLERAARLAELEGSAK